MSEENPTLIPLPKDKDFVLMREIVEALRILSFKGTEAFLHARLPNPAHHFAGTIMFLLSALHAGKLDEWLGPAAAHALAIQGKKELKDKLISIMKDTLDYTPRDQTIGEWKTYPIPLHYNNAFEMLRLYVHNDADNPAQQSHHDCIAMRTRFVITMHMSQLGSIQLDGLSQQRKLDLIIRSENELPELLKASIKENGLSALDSVGLIGTITFQSGRSQWVSIKDNIPKSSNLLM
jgi:hypothetical protein